LRRALGDKLRHREVIAGVGEIGVVIRGQHGDGENAQTAFPRLDRGPHGLRIGVHREESGPDPRHAFDARGDGVADVVQFHVDEELLAAVDQRRRIGKSAGERELIADLVERHRVAEPCHHGLRFFDRGHVERDDQPVAGLHLHRSILRDG
jgi:hypothetical protein